MITVLHLIDTGGPGGAEKIFLQLATHLDVARFRSVPVVSKKGWLSGQLSGNGLEPKIIPSKGSFNLNYLLRLSQVLRQERADVVLAHLYGSAVYASLLGLVHRTPVISVFHGQTDVSATGRFNGIKAGIVRRGSRRLVFVSKHLRDDLAVTLRSSSRSVVIPNGIDTEIFSPGRDISIRSELDLPARTRLIGAIGNIRAPKAYDILLNAIRILGTRVDRIHLVVAGDADGKLGQQLMRLRDELGLERHVSFLGHRADVVRILRNLDVFVLSSTTEGFSLACIEAMACGVPVVATESGGPQEILEGGAGVLVPPRDPAALAAAIERVLCSPGRAEGMIANASERVKNRYSVTGMLARYEELLMGVAVKSGGRDSGSG